jgi:serine/threonine protein kinase/Flp pilus assembly protein TadD
VELPLTRPVAPTSSPNHLKTEVLSNHPCLEDGTVLAQRFRIIKKLGAGAQGLVYAANDELLDTKVALKVVEGTLSDPAKMSSVRNEVNIARQLQHPNIIRVHDVFCDEKIVFFTMEFVPGEPLFERLEREVSQPQFDAWKHQLLEAIAACQAVHVKHGDIKPDNILVDEHNNLRLIDFGIGQSIDVIEQTSGHHYYTAPEVIEMGKTNEQSDLYSAGKVLFDILARVSIPAWSLKAKIWLARQNSLLKKLTARHPQNRPTLDNLLSERNNNTGWLRASLTTVLVVAVAIALYMATNTNAPSDTAIKDLSSKQEPLQLLLLSEPNFPLLETIGDLLRYPLSTHPNIALVGKEQTASLIENLAISPTSNETQRVDLASLLFADTVLMLDATPTSSDSYLLHASLLTMPSNSAVFTTTQSVNTNTLSEDLNTFASRLMAELFDALATQHPLPDLRYLDVLDKAWQKGETLLPAQAIDALTDNSPDYPGGWVAKANLYLEEGNYADAKRALDALMAIQPLAHYWKLQAELIRAQINDDVNLAQQSIDALTSQYPNRPQLLAIRADIYQWAGNDDAAMADYKAALVLRPNDGQLWFNLARLQIINGDIEAAIEEPLTRALVAFRNTKDVRGESLVLNAFGIAHLRMAETETAAKYFKDALVLRKPTTQPSERAKTLANLALTSSMMGYYDKAEASLKEALSLIDSNGELVQKGHILDALGFLYEEQGHFERALEHYKLGLDLRVQLDDSILQPESMSNVAYMHFLIGDLSLAEIYWQQAKVLFERNGDKVHLLRTLQHLAQLSLVKGNYTMASRYLSNVENQLSDENEHERLYSHLLYSFFNFANGEPTQAQMHINEAVVLAEKIGDLKGFVEATLWRGEICLKTADWQCLQDTLTKVEPEIAPQQHEQYAVYRWLQIAMDNHNGQAIDIENVVLEMLEITQQVPVITTMKVLLDLQQRLDLSETSEFMTTLSSIVKPTYYQPYLDWLYLKALFGNDKALNQLEQQVTLYDKYWRNHIFYSVIPNQKERQQILTSQWLNRLPEAQAKNYRMAYLE